MSSVSNIMYDVCVDGFEQKIGFKIDEFLLKTDDKEETWKFADVIGIEDQETETGKTSSFTLHIMQETENNKLIDKMVNIKAEKSICDKVTHKLAEELGKVSFRPKNLLVLINPVGGSKTGEQQYHDIVAPLFKLAKIKTDVIVSERPKHFLEVLNKYDISHIDGIVICGGDGTVNECIRTIFKRTQEEAGIDYNNPDAKAAPFPVPIGQIPTGTGNGLAGMSCSAKTDVVTLALNVVKGLTINLNIHGVYCGNQLLSNFVVILMFGTWSDLFSFIDNHRWLKTMRYLVLPFYHFLLRPQPRLNVEIKLLRKKRESGSQDSNKCSTGDKDTIHDEIVNLLMMDFDVFTEDFRFEKDIENWNFDCTVANIYRPCGRTQLLSQLLQFFFKQGPDTFVKDFIRNERVIGLKVKVKADQDNNQQPCVLNVDGETLELPHPEFETRLLGQILPVFSSKIIP